MECGSLTCPYSLERGVEDADQIVVRPVGQQQDLLHLAGSFALHFRYVLSICLTRHATPLPGCSRRATPAPAHRGDGCMLRAGWPGGVRLVFDRKSVGVSSQSPHSGNDDQRGGISLPMDRGYQRLPAIHLYTRCLTEASQNGASRSHPSHNWAESFFLLSRLGCCAGGVASETDGSFKKKVEPWPSSDSNQSWPPCRSTSSWQR